MPLCDKKRKIQKSPTEFWRMTKNQGEKIYNTNKCFHYWNLGRRTENEFSNVYCVRNKCVILDNWDHIIYYNNIDCTRKLQKTIQH